MTREYQTLLESLKSIRKKTSFVPTVAVVLGSGLGEFAETIDVVDTVEYAEIENFPISTVEGHRGRFVFGFVEGVPVVAMQGRVHYYEGYPMQKVVAPIRLMGMMGAKAILLTNAAGGVNESFYPGALMKITDHIASFVPSPLVGENVAELGTRFPDMTCVYDKELQAVMDASAKEEGIELLEGVYMQMSGPAFETPSEVKMARILGADAVGMSTACEAMAARHMGMRVCGISCISNLAAGMSGEQLTHEEVQETANRVKEQYTKLVTSVIKKTAAVL